MEGRDSKIQHRRRLVYREGCWCPACRTAQLGPTWWGPNARTCGKPP